MRWKLMLIPAALSVIFAVLLVIQEWPREKDPPTSIRIEGANGRIEMTVDSLGSHIMVTDKNGHVLDLVPTGVMCTSPTDKKVWP